ncbi:MAG: DNA recombination protein RmuC [Halioglobus sp.]
MNINADTILLAAAALAVSIVLALVVSIWRGLSTRRELARSQDALTTAQASLGTAQLEVHGLAVELDQVHGRLHERQTDIERLRAEAAKLQQALQDALRHNAELETSQRERASQHQEQLTLLNDARDNLKREFENLANRIFEDKGRHFTHTSRASLEDLLKPFREQIAGFQQRINEVHSESIKGNSTLEAEIRKVLDVGLEMNAQAANLTLALKGDKKTTGNWGEAQLQRTLELAGLQAGEHYETQASFRDEHNKRKVPDFVIKLPDGKNIVVDSKVSLVDYDRAIAADSDEGRTEALNAHAQAVRQHIDDLGTKDYANLPNLGSPDFVLMFMPVEPAYIEAMKHNKDLFNYGYQKGVIMVSHTTLMPILRTVANLWMIDQSNREAREISDRAGDIYNQVCRVAERLDRLGNSMRAAQNHYNDTVTSLAGKQGLYGKVERFQQLSAKTRDKLPGIEPIHEDLEQTRLEAVSRDMETATSNTEPDASPTAGG